MFSTMGWRLSESHQWNGINRKVFKVEFNKELNSLLGARWDERIMNKNGDFALSKKELSNFGCIQEIPLKNSSSWSVSYLCESRPRL